MQEKITNKKYLQEKYRKRVNMADKASKTKKASKFKGFNNILAVRLRQLMYGSGTTQQELAEKTGCSRQAVAQYMDGSNAPNIDKLILIADFFNVSIDYLVGKDKEQTEEELVQSIVNYTGLSEKSVEKLHTKLDNGIMKKSIDGETVFVNAEKVFEIAAKLCGKEISEVKNDYTNGDENTRSTIENYAAVYLREIEDNKTYLKYLNELIEEDFTITDIITTLNNYISRCSLSENDDNGGLKTIKRNMEYFDILSIALCLKDFADKLRGENNVNNT